MIITWVSHKQTNKQEEWILNPHPQRVLMSISIIYKGASVVARMVMNLPAMRQTQIQSLSREDPLEEGMARGSLVIRPFPMIS